MLRQALVTVFFLGHLRPAPGTWGSLPTAAVAWMLLLFHAPPLVVNLAMAGSLVLWSGVCVILGGAFAEKVFGRRDPSEVVADEAAGQAIPLLFLPAQAFAVQGTQHAFWRLCLVVGVAFLAFRLFDIIKPWPCRRLERLSGGAGVLADDLAAGLYAAAVVQVAVRWMW
ncbi:MAG: phosphatidylglycerophosphatase A [Phycisphaerales bacterium]|nr:phosphatidylglycerophosphatase A [Phycisphaerales bacterium]